MDKAELYMSLGKLAESIECYDKAIDLNPEYAPAWNYKGIALRRLGKLDESMKCYDTVIAFNPNYIYALNNKAEAILDRQENYTESLILFERVIELNPGYASAWFGKGKALDYQGKRDKALIAYDKATELAPSNANYWYTKSLVLKILGRTAEADAAIAKARELGINETDRTSWLDMLDSVTYDLVQRHEMINEGAGSASNVQMTVGLLQSIAPYQEVISAEFSPQYYDTYSDVYGNQFARFRLGDMDPGELRTVELYYKVIVRRQSFDLNQCNGMLPDEFINAKPSIESDA